MLLEKIKQVIKEPKLIYYFLQGHFNMFLMSVGLISNKRRNSAIEKILAAPDCLDNIYCTECGCNFLPMAFSDKPCKKEPPCFGTKK